MNRLAEQLRSLMEGRSERQEYAAEAQPSRVLSEAKVWATKGMLDFGWQPFSQEVEIGLGGEWWAGSLSPQAGKSVAIHHRKEKVDPAYKPVFVAWEFAKDRVVVTITGGFLSEPATVEIGAQKVVSEGSDIGESSGGVRISQVPGALKQIETEMSTVQKLLPKAERYIQEDLKEVLGEAATQAQVDVALDGKFLTVDVTLALLAQSGPEGAFDAQFKQVQEWAKASIPWRTEVTAKGNRIRVLGQTLIWRS